MQGRIRRLEVVFEVLWIQRAIASGIGLADFVLSLCTNRGIPICDAAEISGAWNCFMFLRGPNGSLQYVFWAEFMFV